MENKEIEYKEMEKIWNDMKDIAKKYNISFLFKNNIKNKKNEFPITIIHDDNDTLKISLKNIKK